MENTLYSFFSVIVQAFVALLALTGIFLIYRFSELSRLIDQIKLRINNEFFEYFESDNPKLIDTMEFIKTVDKIKIPSGDTYKEERNKFLFYKSSLDKHYNEVIDLISHYMSFAILTIFFILVSLFLLIKTTELIKLASRYINMILVFMLGTGLGCLLQAFVIVLRSLEPRLYPRSKHKILRFLNPFSRL